jgi:hypothetical protein
MPIGMSMTTRASFRAARVNSGLRSRVSSKTGEGEWTSLAAKTQYPRRAPSMPIICTLEGYNWMTGVVLSVPVIVAMR